MTAKAHLMGIISQYTGPRGTLGAEYVRAARAMTVMRIPPDIAAAKMQETINHFEGLGYGPETPTRDPSKKQSSDTSTPDSSNQSDGSN